MRAVDVRRGDGMRTFAADLPGVALRSCPADDLVLQGRYVSAGDPTSVGDDWSATEATATGLTVVGSADGWPADDLTVPMSKASPWQRR